MGPAGSEVGRPLGRVAPADPINTVNTTLPNNYLGLTLSFG